MILLDTDSLTLIFHGNANLLRRIATLPDSEVVAISIVTRIETLRGRFEWVLKAADGGEWLRADEQLLRTEASMSRHEVLRVDPASAAKFDELREVKGLRENWPARLMLIACIALANDALLVSRNLRDFRQVPGLRVENWAD